MKQSHLPSYYRIQEQKASAKDSQTPSIRFLKFSYFRLLKEFPRYPDNANYTIPLSAIGEESREKSLFIFISHRWLRSNSKCSGWSGRPHPDTARNDGFKLCLKGIEQIIKQMASSTLECYLWMDYCCLNQNALNEAEVLNLDKVIELCDAVFTPVHDPDYDSWNYHHTSEPHFSMYQSPQFLPNSKNEFAYFNRAWCRLEMFFAANAKIKFLSAKRVTSCFTSELLYYLRQRKRPHFVYGTKEYVDIAPPITLPPLSNDYLMDLSPEDGFCTEDIDCEFIQVLFSKLNQIIEERRDTLLEAESKQSVAETKTPSYEDRFQAKERSDEKHDFFQRKNFRDDEDGERSRSNSVYSDEFLFENRDHDSEMNVSMFNKGIYASPFDD